MTRIFTDGAEMGDALFWDYSATVTIGTTSPAPIGGTYYYKLWVAAYNCFKSFAPISECYYRMRVYSVTPKSNIYLRFRLGGTDVAWLTLDSSFHWQAAATTIGILGTSVEVVMGSRWYLIEVYFKEANAPDGRFVLYVDGSKVIDYTGDTQPASETTFDNIEMYATTGGQFAFDDLAMNDTNGSVDNSWCGDGIIINLTPSGSGTTNNWLNSGSVSGSANYLYVDEYPNDGDTTHVYASGSNTGHQDQYRLSSFDGTGKLVSHIYTEARARKTIADNAAVKLGYLPDGGSDQLSGSLVLTTDYTRIVGTSASANPVTGIAWTEADLNALEFVCEVN